MVDEVKGEVEIIPPKKLDKPKEAPKPPPTIDLTATEVSAASTSEGDLLALRAQLEALNAADQAGHDTAPGLYPNAGSMQAEMDQAWNGPSSGQQTPTEGNAVAEPAAVPQGAESAATSPSDVREARGTPRNSPRTLGGFVDKKLTQMERYFASERALRAKPLADALKANEPWRTKALQENGWRDSQIEQYFIARAIHLLAADTATAPVKSILRGQAIFSPDSEERRLVAKGDRVILAHWEREAKRQRMAKAFEARVKARGKLTWDERAVLNRAAIEGWSLSDNTNKFSAKMRDDFAGLLTGLGVAEDGKWTDEQKKLLSEVTRILEHVWMKPLFETRQKVKTALLERRKGTPKEDATRAKGEKLGRVETIEDVAPSADEIRILEIEMAKGNAQAGVYLELWRRADNRGVPQNEAEWGSVAGIKNILGPHRRFLKGNPQSSS